VNLSALMPPLQFKIFNKINVLRIALFTSLCLLSACHKTDSSAYQPEFSAKPASAIPQYVFGIHPQRNPKKLHAVFGPLVDYLNANVQGVNFVFEASRNFAAFDKKLAERQFAFALPNPYGTINGIDSGYRVFGKMGNENDLRGLIVVRHDSSIKSIADLKGKTLSFPAPTALAATLLTKYFLHSHGLNVNTDFKSLYVGSMESSLMNVYQLNVAAGTAYPPAWRDFVKSQPQVAAKLKIMWQTETLPDNSLMARDDMPAELVARVAQTLFNMHKNKEGRAVLAHMDLAMFKPASNENYQPVRAFIAKYQANIGPVDQPSKR
jgi:phosphonate transport system substrate-binding protein